MTLFGKEGSHPPLRLLKDDAGTAPGSDTSKHDVTYEGKPLFFRIRAASCGATIFYVTKQPSRSFLPPGIPDYMIPADVPEVVESVAVERHVHVGKLHKFFRVSLEWRIKRAIIRLKKDIASQEKMNARVREIKTSLEK